MQYAFIANNNLDALEQDAQFAATHGFTGLEFNYWANFADLQAETVAQMKAILDRHGVQCSSFGIWGWNHTSPDGAERQTALGHLDRAIEFASTLGASVLVTGGGNIPGGTLDDNIAAYLNIFPPYLQKIWDAGMQVSMYAVHGNSFFDGMAAYERLWEHYPTVGLKFDPANWMHHGDDPLPIVRDHGDKINYMHIKEHVYMDGQLVSQPAAGMGDVPWGKIFAFLYEHNYNGYLSFEPHGPLWSKPPLRHKMLILSKRYLEQFVLS